MANTTTQTANTFSLTGKEFELVKASASAFAQSEVFAQDAIKSVAAALGTAPTFGHWEYCRAAWQNEYASAKKANEVATAKAWQRIAARMGEEFGLEKPKATTAKAVKVSESRAKAKEMAAQVIQAAMGKPVELVKSEELTALVAKPDFAKLTPTNRNVILDAIKVKQREETKEADKAANEADKALRDEARDILKGLHGKSLEKALAALRKIK